MLLRAHAMMEDKLLAAWTERSPGLPLADPYEVLILASIVERETALDAERPVVAGVLTRRLEQNMRLQVDPTVIYGLGAAYAGNITRAHLRGDTPYNTYTRHGLPPTPISLPVKNRCGRRQNRGQAVTSTTRLPPRWTEVTCFPIPSPSTTRQWLRWCERSAPCAASHELHTRACK